MLKNSFTTFALFAAASWCGASTQAQWVGGAAPVGVYGNFGASTAAEGAGYGMASVISAQGSANLQNSEAVKNMQQAQSMALDNDLKSTNTYFEMKRVNKAYKDSVREKPLSTDQLYRIAQEGAPKRPGPSQLDPLTGEITWPMVLRDPRYVDQQKEIQELFASRAEVRGNIGYPMFQKIQTVCTDLLAALQNNLPEYKPGDYMQAKTFVQGLAYEAKFPIRY